MREIKFRAWDTYNKILRYAKNYGTIAVLFEELDYRDDLVLMQYTGLKDKNGKEIYEGDIVKYKEKYFTIIYRLIKAQFEMTTNPTNEPVFYEFGSLTKFKCETEIEVIGNIYEKSKLFEENK